MNKTKLIAFIILLTSLSIYFLSCSKETKVEPTLNSKIQEGINGIYRYKGDIAMNWDNRKTFTLPDIFDNYFIKEKVRKEMYFFARHTGITENPYPLSTNVNWNESKIINGFYVIKVEIDKQEYETTEVDENRDSVQPIRNGTSKVDLIHYYTLKIIGDDFKIVNYNSEGIIETTLSDFANPYTKEEYEKERSRIENDPELKYWDKYIEGLIDFNEFMNNVKNSESKKLNIRGSYNRTAAADYSYIHSQNYNSLFKSYYPTDCSNFVSQCVNAGGFKNDGTSKTSCDDWWYNTNNTSKTSDDTESQTWATANGIRRYFQVCNNYQKYASTVSASSGYYATGIQKGDLLFWDFGVGGDGIFDHAMMVYRIDKYVDKYQCYYYPRLCAHTGDIKDYSILNYGYDKIVNKNVVKFSAILATN